VLGLVLWLELGQVLGL